MNQESKSVDARETYNQREEAWLSAAMCQFIRRAVRLGHG
jgi:hypothetical protein